MSTKKEYTWQRGSTKVSERTIGSSSVKQRNFSSLDSDVKRRLKNGR